MQGWQKRDRQRVSKAETRPSGSVALHSFKGKRYNQTDKFRLNVANTDVLHLVNFLFRQKSK
jgi:hypothetical protein